MKIQLFLVVLFVSLQIGANAQCPIDQSQLLTNGGVSARNRPGYYEGQTFTAGATGLLCEIDLLMTNTMTGTGTLNIFSGSGISGTLLATESVNVNVPSGSVWQYWTISSPPSITSGSVYTFQFIPIQGGGLPDPYLIDLRDSNVYSGGYHLAFPQFDLTFRTYVNSPTWNCNNGVCSDPGTGTGAYASLTACQAACVVVTPSWNCNNGVCSDPGTGTGAYTSLTACQTVCGTTAIEEQTTNKELLKVTDLLGRETKATNQLLFYIFDDGTVEKKIVIE